MCIVFLELLFMKLFENMNYHRKRKIELSQKTDSILFCFEDFLKKIKKQLFLFCCFLSFYCFYLFSTSVFTCFIAIYGFFYHKKRNNYHKKRSIYHSKRVKHHKKRKLISRKTDNYHEKRTIFFLYFLKKKRA